MIYANQGLNLKVQQIENLITQAKASLKSWASQISKHHKSLKEITRQLNSLKSQLNMKPNLNQPNQKSTK